MSKPSELRDYLCDEYFESPWRDSGYWSEEAQLMLILPVGTHVLREQMEFLVIGHAGVDGLEFGYRRGRHGLWTYYRIDDEFVLVARSLSDLIDGYTSGRITV